MGLRAGDGLIRSRSSPLREISGENVLSTPLKPQSSQENPRNPVQRKQPGQKPKVLFQRGGGNQRQDCYQPKGKEILRTMLTNWEITLCGPTYLKQEIESLPPQSPCSCKAVKAHPGPCKPWLLIKTWLLVRMTMTTCHWKAYLT